MSGENFAAVRKVNREDEAGRQGAVRKRPRHGTKRKRQPRYHVVLWDDDDHTYDYVIRMMQELFSLDEQRAYEIAQAVDNHGRAICLTSTFEYAEFKRDQIRAFGKDSLIGRCAGSMYATIQPEH